MTYPQITGKRIRKTAAEDLARWRKFRDVSRQQAEVARNDTERLALVSVAQAWRSQAEGYREALKLWGRAEGWLL